MLKIEETSLFVRVEKLLEDSTIFEDSHKEHDAFMPGLQQFQDYLKVLGSPQEFSGVQLLSIMAGFQETFESHFRAEISTIAKLAEHPRTPRPGSKEELRTNQDFDAKEGNAIIKSGVIDIMPFFLFNLDLKFESRL